jgi:uncharacterized protein (TIGR03083 family)
LFRPVSSSLVGLLHGLPPAAWERATIAGSWVVRDVVAHIVDVTFRRLSFHRDGMAPPPPPRAIVSDRDFAEFINWLNAQWVGATRRLSPRVLTDLLEKGSADLADWFEQLPMDGPALFGVSWAGEHTSEGWFDVGREFTELWHHQQQIRLAVGAPALDDPRYLHAVLEIAVRGLPHAYGGVQADAGRTVVIDAEGTAGGTWTLLREADRWVIQAGAPEEATVRVRVSDDALCRLLFNALPERAARGTVHIDGHEALALPLLRARSVIV